MRVLKIFFVTLTLVLAAGLVAVFVGREVVLSAAVNQVRSALRSLKTVSVDPTFIESCLEYGGLPPQSETLVRTQLRFTSPSQYVTEVVCQNTESLRQTIQTGALPLLVRKGAGQSGVIDGQTLHGVTLSALGRTGVVYVEEGVVHGSIQSDSAAQLTLTDGPSTVCEGYSFTCCSEVSQVGQGDQQPAALDCPRSCYSSCAEKPVVVSFQSDPQLTPENRILALRSGQTAQFFYTVSDIADTPERLQLQASDSPPTLKSTFTLMVEALFTRRAPRDHLRSMTLSFGDGQSAEVSDLQGVVEHTYTCTRALCIYNATLQAVTETGITSTLTPNSRIQVQVSP